MMCFLTHARRRGSRIFEISSSKEKSDHHLVASRKPLVGVPRTEGRAAREVANRSGGHELRRNAGKGSSMRTPLPQQSSSSTMEAESSWSAQERTAMARMEQYVNNSECIHWISMRWRSSLGPEYVDVKQIFKKGDKRRQEKLKSSM